MGRFGIEVGLKILKRGQSSELLLPLQGIIKLTATIRHPQALETQVSSWQYTTNNGDNHSCICSSESGDKFPETFRDKADLSAETGLTGMLL